MSPAAAYPTPSAFRMALTDRLRQRAREKGIDVARLHRLVAFDRVLARMFAGTSAPPWILKGGCALEMRYGLAARATIDLDLGIPDATAGADRQPWSLTRLHDLLQEAAERDLGDGFTVRIAASVRDFEAPPAGGARFPVQVFLAGKRFSSLSLDVGIGDAAPAGFDLVQGEAFLDFAGIPPACVPALSAAGQFAEKSHAYTLPRDRFPNTRVKDLVDLVLILEKEKSLSVESVREAVVMTFERRATHPIPAVFPLPPIDWEVSYERLAGESGLVASTLSGGHGVIADRWSRLGLARRK